MDFSWAVEGVTDEVPRTTGPECINYMTNRRRWLESIIFTLIFIYIIKKAVQRLEPIILPPPSEINKPHTALRLLLLISMTFIFGIEMGFKFSGKSVIFVLNPCHIQTVVQIYLLASKPNKVTIALFRIQMNNLNGPVLAFMFPEVECRTLPFEQATYWIQHALLYIIPVYILQSGAYKVEDINDYNWVTIGVMIMLLYHFVILNALSIYTGINLNHMLCAAVADPFQGQNYRIAAVIHESILCPILNKGTVLIFNRRVSKQHDDSRNQSSYTTEKMPSLSMLHNNKSISSAIINGNGFEYEATDRMEYNDNTNTEALLLYHQQQQQEEQAAAMAASSDAILKHRRDRRHTADYIYNPQLTSLAHQKPLTPASMAAEYTTTTLMPTTKID